MNQIKFKGTNILQTKDESYLLFLFEGNNDLLFYEGRFIPTRSQITMNTENKSRKLLNYRTFYSFFVLYADWSFKLERSNHH